MRENWNRATEQLIFTDAELESLLEPAFPSSRILKAEIAEGGLANTNIKVALANQEKPVLIRFFVREAAQAAKEYRLSQMSELCGIMPQYFYLGESNAVTGHPYVIMEWVEGVRLELVAAELDLARSLGRTMAHIHSIHFECTGFFDSQLNVVLPVELGGDGLAQHARQCLVEGLGKARLGAEFSDQFFDFIESKGSILDHWPGNPCLAHSDFGGSNILVDGAEVRAVLDWEFAFSGNPAFDFGNLLRADFGKAFEQSLAKAYREAGGRLPDNWRQISLMADLYSWLDFLNRPAAGPALIADAERIMRETMKIC